METKMNKDFPVDQIEQMGKTTVTVFVSEEMKEDLKRLADSEQRSLSQMAAILLQQGLAKAKEEGKIG